MTKSNQYLNIHEAVRALPLPFSSEGFYEWRRGVYEAPDVSVYLNALEDFAFLYPQSALDYSRYQPRVKSLGLEDYRRRMQVVERRFKKIQHYFCDSLKVLEIGSYDGALLALARESNSLLGLASLETDANTKPDRDKLDWLQQYSEFSDLAGKGVSFDLVCFFHVLEHIIDPTAFLNACSNVLRADGKLIVEVPCLEDPLLGFYGCEAYRQFYFQPQHPYVYSAKSLCRLLNAHDFEVQSCIPHQRYGLENHLTWLTKGKPGGDETLRAMFSTLDDSYRRQLEIAGQTDAVIVVATKARE